jgi:ribonuclease BN (tRNA processing enzyme)
MNKFLILGCGHSEALTLFNNNAVVINSQGLLLIDCGHTIKHALHNQNMNIGMVDAVFITHVHGDHIFGLERLAFETRYKYQKNILVFSRKHISRTLGSDLKRFVRL